MTENERAALSLFVRIEKLQILFFKQTISAEEYLKFLREIIRSENL